MHISKRVQQIDNSGIRKMFGLAAQMKNPIDLSIGVPDFDVYPEIRQAAKEAIDSGVSGRYSVTQGLPALCERLRERYGIVGSENLDVMITAGVAGGFTTAYMAVLDPGDEILVPDPYFVIYNGLAAFLNATPKYFNTYPNFKLPLEQIESLITDKTRAIVLNSPGNPTGASYDQNELNAAIEIAKKNDIWVIYDEIYDAFCYDAPHPRASFEQYQNIIVLNGQSKSHGMPGWRMGFAVGPKRVLAEMMKVQQYSFVCANTVGQYAMVRGLDVDTEPMAATYREKRDFMVNALKAKFNFVTPGGAFYLFPEAPGGSGTEFVKRCLEKELLVVPGGAFSQQDTHFRISFAAPMERLERGAEVLNSLV